MRYRVVSPALLSLILTLSLNAHAQVLISEVHYHPVEEPAFNADGSPVLDLSDDVHEFVELHNAGTVAVSLAGWQLSGGIQYSFPSNTVFQAGTYLVIAKDPARLAAVPEYHLAPSEVLGPYQGKLSNQGDTVRVRGAAGNISDSLTYSPAFPWAISADALGADQEWSGLDRGDYQYRGRSLERVSFSVPANDPANWVASPIGGNPSPGRPNSVSRAVPKPVVVQLSVSQDSDGAPLIRQQQSARIECQFSSAAGLSSLRVEWFLDSLEQTNEPVQSTALQPMSQAGAGWFQAVLPGQSDRTLVRYRIRGDRGDGDEVISPRADDPFAWQAYFVTPVRTSTRPIYDCLISSNSLRILNTNIGQNPRRVTSPDPPGKPRVSWNATEPAVVVENGVVYDIRMRYHGSRYNRTAGRNSFKWQFPRYQKFHGVTGIFETDKGNDFVVGHGLFRAIGLPVSAVRYVDFYLNNRTVMQRLEQGEFDGDMLDEYHRNQQALNPGSAREASGEIYKNVGTIDMNGEGPYGRGDGRLLKKPPYWTDLQMYSWTYALQNHGWRGAYDWKQMIDAFWAARGDTPSAPNPNVPSLREFFAKYFDIDEMLTYIALENWCCPWDDTTQNHFFWRQHDGRWGMLPWDDDAWFGNGDNTPATASIYMGEVGDPNNNFRGPNFFKDGFIKAYREELKQRYFLLNNTFLHPDNLAALGFSSIQSFAQARMASVNQQCGFGTFERPAKPDSLSPSGGTTALPPGRLSAGPYQHSATPARPHAQTIWEIRSATGSYLAPIWKLTSTNDLTSVAIPFASLIFGQQYYWRCTYLDADGHPSVPADEVSFAFGPAAADRTLVGVSAADLWRYDQSGTDLSTQPWTEGAFDDSSWASGPALLAKEESALPYPIRTPLTLGPTTYYFRKHFILAEQPDGGSARLRYVIDDGCVIYLNGHEVLRVRMPDGPVAYSTYANQTVGNAVEEGPVDIPGSYLQPGDNVLAAEVHQANASSSDIVFGATLEATFPARSGSVVLNEVAAKNTGSVAVDGTTPDWVELYNQGPNPVNLAGFGLSDDMLRPLRFVFPTSTLLPAGGFLTIWFDARTNAPGLHTGFALNDQGQTLALFARSQDGLTVSDFVQFGLQLPDRTLARVPNGTGPWHLSQPTPGAPNQAATLGSAGGLKINEWMALPEQGNDWVEIFNPGTEPVELSGLFLTDDPGAPTKTRVADLSFIGPVGFLKLVADSTPNQGASHLGFKLSASGEFIGLFAADASTLIDGVHFGPQTAGVSEGRWPDGSETTAPFPGTASPGAPNQQATGVGWHLSIAKSEEGPIQIRAHGGGSGQIVLQMSVDLVHWTTVATAAASGGALSYPDATGASSTRYYRAVLQP